MPQRSFEQDIFIQTPPETVRAFLSTLQNHTKIHPLIINIQHTGTRSAADGTSIDMYVIRDRTKVGPFNVTNSYRVEMNITSQGNIIYDAYQFPRIFLHNTTYFVPEGTDGAGTRLTERVEITAPGFLMNMVYTQAFASHKEMFVALKKLLE